MLEDVLSIPTQQRLTMDRRAMLLHRHNKKRQTWKRHHEKGTPDKATWIAVFRLLDLANVSCIVGRVLTLCRARRT